MACLTVILLLAITSTAVGQCEYVYVAEPPSGQLICDPFQNGPLQLVCSIFATEISKLPDILMIQWHFSAPVNRQFNPSNAVLLENNRFTIAQRQTYTSRIVVSNPPSGFYFCQPVLASGKELIRSNVVPLQPRSFYQQRQIRPCLINEFQNSSVAVCAQLGVMLGPDQIIAPAPTVVETIQYVSSTILNTMLTPTPVLEQGTATPTAVEGMSTSTTPLIAGVVVSAVLVIVIAVIIISGILIFIQLRKRKFNGEYPRTLNSRYISNGERYAKTDVSITDQTNEIQEVPFVPPRKPPPKLQRLSLGTKGSPRVTNHLYNRLRFPKSKMNKSQLQPRSGSESSAYYITPEHNNSDEVEYYVDFDEENLDKPYVDESESLIYTDSQYSTESDLHLHQQIKQQSFVRSSSLELQLDKEDAHTQAALMMNGGSQLPNAYQNCLPKNKKENGKVKSNMAMLTTDECFQTSLHQDVVITKELGTEYTNAEVLERSTVI